MSNVLGKISFRFDGDLATNCELNFYEAGRFQYGAARFIFTLEKFRQTGRIVEKLRERVKADIRVKAARRGSYLQEVLMYALPIAVECAVSVPFEAIFTYIWDSILPKSEGRDAAVEIAKAEVERERERSIQAGETTKQMALINEVAMKGLANSSQAIEILGNALVRKDANPDDTLISLEKAKIKQFISELQEEESREKIITKNKKGLAKISPEQEKRLAGQLRKSIPDITTPLKNSANILAIGTSKTHVIANLDINRVSSITNVKETDELETISVSIKSYDTENGNGKMRLDELRSPINFRVPTSLRLRLKDTILDAMKLETIEVKVYYVVDAYNNIVSIILVDIILPDNNFDFDYDFE